MKIIISLGQIPQYYKTITYNMVINFFTGHIDESQIKNPINKQTLLRYKNVFLLQLFYNQA